jgi:hypothetical protein
MERRKRHQRSRQGKARVSRTLLLSPAVPRPIADMSVKEVQTVGYTHIISLAGHRGWGWSWGVGVVVRVGLLIWLLRLLWGVVGGLGVVVGGWGVVLRVREGWGREGGPLPSALSLGVVGAAGGAGGRGGVVAVAV